MRIHILVAAASIAALAAGADTAKKTTKRIPVRVSKSPSKTPARSVAGRSNAGKSSAKPAVYSAPHQAGPTPDRYREIQDSLISKGYMQGPASGVWDQNSVEAMKKFQQDQKIDPTGKVTAKSLITLGLGPKDESAPSTNK